MKKLYLFFTIIILSGACGISHKEESSDYQESSVDNINPGKYGIVKDIGYALYLPNISYTKSDESSSPFLKLDLYFKNLTNSLRPILVYLHGAGWQGPDVIDGAKENIQKSPNLISFFVNRGFMVASLNRRQIDFSKSPAITYKEQLADIAKALKWLQSNGSKIGGDSQKIIIMGYSSGAHLAAMIVSDTRYLFQEQVNTSGLRGVMAIDFHAYDVPLALSLMPGTSLEDNMRALKVMFGDSLKEQVIASPMSYISKQLLPPILLISAGVKDGKKQNVSNVMSARYKDSLLSFQHQVQHFHFPNRDHTELLGSFGKSGDTLEKVFENFLDKIFSSRTMAPISQNLKLKITNLIKASVSETQVNPSKVPGMAVGIITPHYQGVVGIGTTEIGKSITPNGDTFFGIGSVSKIFVGLALGRKVAEKKIAIDRPAKLYLPDSLSVAFNGDITIKELITHQSGLKSMPENIDIFRDENHDGINDYVDWSPAYNYQLSHLSLCLRDGFCAPQLAKRGSYQYSNLGIAFASLIVEKICQLGSFEDLLKNYFNHELGMDDTGTNVIDFISKTPKRRAIGYQLVGNTLVARAFSDMGVMAGSGEIISTPNDLLTLLEFFLKFKNNNILFNQSAKLAMEKIFEYEQQKAIGFAIDIMEDDQGNTFYHKSGATKSSQAYIIWNQEYKVGAVVMANGGGGTYIAGKLGKSVIDLLLEEQP